MYTHLENTEAFIKMLTLRWSCARKLNTHPGIRSATIHVSDADEEDISRLDLAIRQVQKRLGVAHKSSFVCGANFSSSKRLCTSSLIRQGAVGMYRIS